MTDIGEEIINRLPETCGLHDPNNPVRPIIVDGLGGVLQDWIDNFNYEDFFINTAHGGYLDRFGKVYNVTRKTGEDDDSYRERIILTSLGHLTVDYLEKLFGLDFMAFVREYNPDLNILTSDNPYNNSNGLMALVSEDMKAILEKKFILDSKVHLWTAWSLLFYDSCKTGTINPIWLNTQNRLQARSENTGYFLLRENMPNAGFFVFDYLFENTYEISFNILVMDGVYVELFNSDYSETLDIDIYGDLYTFVNVKLRTEMLDENPVIAIYFDDEISSYESWEETEFKLRFVIPPGTSTKINEFKVVRI